MDKSKGPSEFRASSEAIVAIGGAELNDAKSVEYYDSDSNVWNELIVLDVDRTYYKTGFLNGKLILTGGFKGSKPSRDVQSYDFDTGTLSTIASLNIARRYHGVAVTSGHMFVLGGAYELYVDSAERYDPIANEWTEIKPMPTPSIQFAAVVLNGEIYAIGGFYDKYGYLNRVESYNPVRGTWKTCASLNEKREGAAAAALRNLIYVAGGRNENGQSKTVEKYDPFINSWTSIERDMGISRFMNEGIDYNDSMLVAGGFDEDEQLISIVEIFDTNSNQWITIAPSKTPRAHFSLVEVPWEFIKKTIDMKEKYIKKCISKI